MAVCGRLLLVVCLSVAATAVYADAEARLEVVTEEITIGDPIAVRLEVSLPEGATLERAELGPKLGEFEVADGGWGEDPVDDGRTWVWDGTLRAFRTGEFDLPGIELTYSDGDAERSVSTEPVTIAVRSVLDEEDLAAERPEIADLKAPVGMPPRLGPLILASSILLVLLLVSFVAWWLHRRYRDRLVAVEAPDDPFARTTPHEWIYAELQALLEQRLPEQGRVDTFYESLARLLEQYLEARFRVDLLERTTSEIPEVLSQGGVEREVVDRVVGVLDDCDQVKFAGAERDADRWKQVVEEIYRIVDSTKVVADDARGVA